MQESVNLNDNRHNKTVKKSQVENQGEFVFLDQSLSLGQFSTSVMRSKGRMV